MLPRGALKVAQAFAVDLALEGADGSVIDGETVVGYDQTFVDLNDAAEAPAFGAGADGGVEREECRRGGVEALACFGRTEAVDVSANGLELVVEEFDLSLAEVEGRLERFDRAGACLVVQDRDAILDDKEWGVESGE